MNFEIIFYEENGKSHIAEFLNTLDNKLLAKVLRNIDLLSEYGNSLGMPFSRYIGNGIFELRTKGKDSIIRILYFSAREKIIITNGFVKKQQNLPVDEYRKAVNLKEKYIKLQGGKDE